MVKLNRRTLPLPKLNQLQKDLWKAIASLETSEEVQEFCVDFLTHTERKMLAKRFRIAVLILEGKTYAKIRKELEVGDGVISTVQNLIKTGATTLESVAKEYVREDEKKLNRDDDSEKPRDGYYMTGNILMPVLDDAVRLVKKKIRKKSEATSHYDTSSYRSG